MDITARTLPGLLRKEGRSLDEAGEAAFEAEFFRERPTISELLEALDEEINRGRDLLRDSDAVNVVERDALVELGNTLSDTGVDLQKLRNPKAIAGLREIRDSIGAVEPQAPVARAGAARVEVLADRQEALDAAVEADVRAAYEGREDDFIWLEADYGVAKRVVQLVIDLEDAARGRKGQARRSVVKRETVAEPDNVIRPAFTA